MGRAIVKVGEGEYLIWSSVVDAPVSWITDREGIRERVRFEFGESGVRGIDRSFDRADERGHSGPPNYGANAEEFVRGNRAGDGETELTLDEIRDAYREPPEAGGE